MILYALGGVVTLFEGSPDAYDPTSGQGHAARGQMLVTMVTVGYGDYSPATVQGASSRPSPCAWASATAMPLAIVGNTFSTAWEARALATIREQLKKHLLASNLGATNLEEAFANFDLDGNGSIDYAEFKHVVVDVLGVPLDVKKLRKVWRSLDQDDSNIIKYQEFCLAIFPEYEVSMDTDAQDFGGKASAAGNGTAEAAPSFKRARSPADDDDAPVTGPASRYSPPATEPATSASPPSGSRVGSAGSARRRPSTGRGAGQSRRAAREGRVRDAQQQSLEAAVQRR